MHIGSKFYVKNKYRYTIIIMFEPSKKKNGKCTFTPYKVKSTHTRSH